MNGGRITASGVLLEGAARSLTDLEAQGKALLAPWAKGTGPRMKLGADGDDLRMPLDRRAGVPLWGQDGRPVGRPGLVGDGRLGLGPHARAVRVVEGKLRAGAKRKR